MRLVDLEPRWSTEYGDNRHGLGITFLCPCCLKTRIGVAFSNPVDGGPPSSRVLKWQRTGDTFETLSLSPSLDASRQGHWHGFITNGEVR